MSIFHYIGIAVVALAVLAVGGFVLLWAYFTLLEGRFSAIWFRKGQRRLSIASWHESKLLRLNGAIRDDDWPADDWPIGPRPLYLSFRLKGPRRVFIFAGTLSGPRIRSIKGNRP